MLYIAWLIIAFRYKVKEIRINYKRIRRIYIKNNELKVKIRNKTIRILKYINLKF